MDRPIQPAERARPLRPILRVLEAYESDVASILEALRIPYSVDDPVASAPNQIAPVLYQRILAKLLEVVRRGRHEAYGRSHLGPQVFRVMCYSLIHCQTLEQAIQRSNAFYNLFGERLGDSRLEVNESVGRYVLDNDRTAGTPLQPGIAFDWYRLFRFFGWLVRKPLKLQAARFAASAPPWHARYRRLFDCPVAFDAAQTEFEIAVTDLRSPLRQTETTLNNFLDGPMEALIVGAYEFDDLGEHILAIVERSFGSRFPSFDAIAEQLHVSPATLRRRLAEEGTGYQKIKDHYRCKLAREYLGREQLPVHLVAELLGFEESSTFQRAFKRWTGLTPRDYRASHVGP